MKQRNRHIQYIGTLRPWSNHRIALLAFLLLVNLWPLSHLVKVPTKPKKIEKITVSFQEAEKKYKPKEIIEVIQPETIPPKDSDFVGQTNHRTIRETKVKNPKTNTQDPARTSTIKALKEAQILKQYQAPQDPQKKSYSIKKYQELLPQLEDIRPFTEAGYQDAIRKDIEKSSVIDVNTTELMWLGYFTSVRKQVALTYTSPYQRILRSEEIKQKLAKYGQAHMQGICTVKLTIQRSGVLTEATLIKTSGDEQIDQFWTKILQLSAPFPPLPKAYEKDTLTFTYSLTYDLLFSTPRIEWPKKKRF